MSKARGFVPLALVEEKTDLVEDVIKAVAAPEIGRAIAAANANAVAPVKKAKAKTVPVEQGAADGPVARNRPVKGLFTDESMKAIEAYIFGQRQQGNRITIQYLIAKGFELQGIAISAADLSKDGRAN